MTKVYEGANLYTLHIGHQTIQLSEDEIVEIVDEFIEKSSKNAEYKILYDNLVDQTDGEIKELTKTISDLERENHALIGDE